MDGLPDELQFCLLGPLLIRGGGQTLPVLPGKQRAVLAALLLRANRSVPLEDLAEAAWGVAAPASARGTLRHYVKELRKALAGTGGSRIETVPGGYLIRIGPAELDVLAFEGLRAEALRAAGEGAWDRAAECWRAAAALWRGDALADVTSDWLALREIPRLTEMRLQAVEGRIEADLHLGLQHEVIPDLRQLTAVHPLRERLHGMLMLALYRDGQQAQALAAYQAARQVLKEAVGAEPGSELRDLQRQILTADPAITGPAGPLRSGTEAGQTPVTGQQPGPILPRQLPVDVPVFTGRTEELAELDRMLGDRAGNGAAPAVMISAISGTAGVGKTALAVRWAHQVADRFPDGQLHVNLRGYDPGQPMSAAEALARFLRALGVPGADVPAEPEERAAMYRSLLADRRILLLLDNAGSADQVRPLLPGTPGCAAVVTSRDPLAGLVARDGARRMDLDLLPLADAVSLLRVLIGGRVEADPKAAAALAACCCRLPLALRVAAELAAARPAASLASLTAEVADQQHRLDLLNAGGEPRTAVRTVFSWSIRHLDPAAARAFRLLGLHPGPDFDAYAAAALTGTSLRQASQLLDELGRAHLIQAAGPGRYLMHDLLRDYARELAAAADGADEQRAALTRLFDHYLHAAAAAMDTLYPAEQHQRPRLPAPAAGQPPLNQPDTARAWLAADLPCLVTVAEHAVAHGWPGHTVNLAATLFRYLDSAGYFSEAVTIHGHARDAAQQAGDVAAEARALTRLGVSELRQGDYQRASQHLELALPLSRQAGDRGGEARARANLGVLANWLGRYQQAAGHDQLAVHLYRETGDRAGEAIALGNLGANELRLGRLPESADHLGQALALSRETGDQACGAYALLRLGDVRMRRGQHDEAERHLEQALALSRETGDRVREAGSLASLGELHFRQGHDQQASHHLHQALAMSRAIGECSTEIQALNHLGDVALSAGDRERARSHYADALALASETGETYEQARAHDGLARACHATADHERARHHWRQALTLYTQMGVPRLTRSARS